MILIGISGKKGSGKDTVALFIRELYPAHIPVHIVGFADELKKEMAQSLGVTTSFIETNKQFFRPLLQWWGDYRKKFASDQYWIIQLSKHVMMLPNSIDTLCVIKDVRFKNEYDFIRETGGIMIRVVRDDVMKDAHASENDLDSTPFKYVLSNNGTLPELKREVSKLLKEIEII